MCSRRIRIGNYARVSYDEDKERYESIINQRNINDEFIYETFGKNVEIFYFEDDNYSGYKFDRPDFVKMKDMAMNGELDIIVAKDLSRIGRHNAKTLLFIEELDQNDIRVIAVNDDMDTAKGVDDIVGIKTWHNELYVKETSRKVRSSVKSESKNGTWITNVPYGYVMVDYQKREYRVDPIGAQVVKRIYELYIQGYGYKKIAKLLTEENVATPKTRLKQLWEEQGKIYIGPVGDTWNTASINHIIGNDFYIGTLRTNKYSRKGINGRDKKLSEEENYVFENFHEPIISNELYNMAIKTHESRKREKTHYRGKKKYDNDYTGLMRCGDCGAPMFSISNGKRKPAYYCGSYHNHGRSACTSHHILVSVLDSLVKEYISVIKENSDKIIDYLNAELEKIRRKNKTSNNNALMETLTQEKIKAENELKITMQQKIRDIMKNPDSRDYIENMYEEMEKELQNKINTLKSQIKLEEKNNKERRNVVQAKKDALKIFDQILKKDKLDKRDLETIIDCIYIYEDNIVIKLKSNIESILDIGNNIGIETEEITTVQKNRNHNDREFLTSIKNINNKNDKMYETSKEEVITSNDVKDGRVIGKNAKNQVKESLCSNDVNNGDPLEIFTDREGQVILKKYSPIGELSEFATGYAETLAKTTGHIACITDKDTIIAVSGGSKKEFLEQDVSQELEKLMEDKEVYTSKENSDMAMPITKNEKNDKKNNAQIVYPIISNGDTIGTVILMSKDTNTKMNEVEKKVAQSAATFLASQMEI